MRFFKDMLLIGVKEVKGYYRWELNYFWDMIYPVLDLVLFVTVWYAIFQGGFQSVGILNKENFIGFLLSGILAFQFIYSPLSSQFTQSFIREKYRRTLQNLLISPISRISIPYGKSLLSLVRSTYSTVILIIFSALFLGFNLTGNFILGIFLFLLTFVSFSGLGLILASLGAWREDIASLSWLISYILEISSGVYYPIEALPQNIKEILMLIPSTQAVTAARLIFLKNATFMQVLPHLTYISIFGIITMCLAIICFKFVEKKAMLIGI